MLNYKKDLSLQIGQYCQVHEEEAPCNSQNPRTRSAIALSPSGNLQGGYKFMALNMGKKITWYSWDVIPMPDMVITCINTLGADQPEQLIFTDQCGCLIGDNKIPGVPPEYPVDDEVDGDDPLPDVNLPGVDDAVDAIKADLFEDQAPPNEIIDDLNIPEPDPAPIEPDPIPQEPATAQEPQMQAEEPPVPLPTPHQSAHMRTEPKRYVPSLTGTKYSYMVTQFKEEDVLHPDAHMFMQEEFYQVEPNVVASIMTQLSLKARLKAWGDQAWSAAHSEMKQLHMCDTFKPMHWHDLTPLQHEMVLESHMFLKEKQSGEIKGHTVAGGNKQHDYISKEDASSPTVSTESVLLICIIDALEGRDVAVVDIPNAFIQTHVEKEQDMAIIRMYRVLVDILLEIAPEVYEPFVHINKKGVKQLLLQCHNAIYGTMLASLLYYKKFVKSLLLIGFEINPYDPCIANKMINGKQMTICFHVNDCKLSHHDCKAVNDFIEWLHQEYESIFKDGSGKMMVSQGKVHTYLGMTLDYSTPGQVKISMFDYIEGNSCCLQQGRTQGSWHKVKCSTQQSFQDQ